MLRNYRAGDHQAIAALYPRAILEGAEEHYSTAQRKAWVQHGPDEEGWRKRCEERRPFVVEKRGRVVAFLELDGDGHVHCAYCDPQFQRQGVMTSLLQHAVKTAAAAGLPSVDMEASRCLKPLLEKLGFFLLRENVVKLGEEELVNYTMLRVAKRS